MGMECPSAISSYGKSGRFRETTTLSEKAMPSPVMWVGHLALGATGWTLSMHVLPGSQTLMCMYSQVVADGVNSGIHSDHSAKGGRCPLLPGHSVPPGSQQRKARSQVLFQEGECGQDLGASSEPGARASDAQRSLGLLCLCPLAKGARRPQTGLFCGVPVNTAGAKEAVSPSC